MEPLGQLGTEPVTQWVNAAKSPPVTSCPYKGLHTGNRDHLNDGKSPKGHTRINGIVVQAVITNVRVCVGLCVDV